MTEKLVYSVEEAAEAMGIGRSMIYRLINQGELRSVRIGRRTLIPVQDLMNFLGVEAVTPPASNPASLARRAYLVTVTPVDPSRADFAVR